MDKLPYEDLERLVNEVRTKVPIGSQWRHYKGTEYTVADIAVIEATNEIAVVYTSVEHPTVSFVRSFGIWHETVEWNGHKVARFVRVG